MSGVRSRSRWRWAALSLAALSLAAVGGLWLVGLPTYAGQLQAVARAYDIEVVAADGPFSAGMADHPIRGEAPGQYALWRYAGLFAEGLSLYPPELVRRARLKRVVLCSGLSAGGRPAGGCADCENDAFYLDVSYAAHAPYQRATIHHELFHLIDYRDDGSLEDWFWEALNPGGFRYGKGDWTAQEQQESTVWTSKLPGFLNLYSTTAVHEDKAVLFAHLVVDNFRVEVRAKWDSVLRAKVVRMKVLLRDFCPEMNDPFWAKARAVSDARRR